MAIHSSILASWIAWTEEPGSSVESFHRVKKSWTRLNNWPRIHVGGCKGGALTNGLRSLVKETPRAPSSIPLYEDTMRCLGPRWGPLNPTVTLFSGFKSLEPWTLNVCVYKHCVYPVCGILLQLPKGVKTQTLEDSYEMEAQAQPLAQHFRPWGSYSHCPRGMSFPIRRHPSCVAEALGHCHPQLVDQQACWIATL